MKTTLKCSSFEQLIGLYVENDLRQTERMRVETHLEQCSSCLDLAGDLHESQSVFKSLRSGAVNSAALIDVRQRVLNSVGDLEPAPAWVVAMHRLIFAGLRCKTAIAGIVLAVLVSGGVWYEQSHVVVERPVAPVAEVAAVETPSAPTVQIVPRPRKLPVSNPASPLSMNRVEVVTPEASAVESTVEPVTMESEVPQLAMKFVTDDPDIIIYWLPADKGD